MPVELRVLGRTDLVAADGRSLHTVLAQPKRFGLLVYLASAKPLGFHRRDELLALFWPDHPEDRARNALNQALSFLRRSIGDALVSRGHEEVGVDRLHLVCDAGRFGDELDDGRLDNALELYRGDLLDAFHVDDAPAFGEWLERERRALKDRAAAAAAEVARRHANAGDADAALSWTRRAASLSPHDEAIAMELVSLHNQRGERALAIEAYDDFRRRLTVDLDVRPSAQLEALVAGIRLRANGHAGTASEPVSRSANGARSGATAAPSPLLPRSRFSHPLRFVAQAPPLVLVTLLAIVSFGWWRTAHHRAGDDTIRFRLGLVPNVRRAHSLGAPPTVAVSPQGDQIAYVAGADGVSRLFVRRLDELSSRALPGTEGAEQPFFSPDGRWIGFVANGRLSKIEAANGRVTVLAPVPEMVGATWASPNDIVISTERALATVPAGGGAVRAITRLDSAGEFAQRWPLAIDDGAAVLYASFNFGRGHLTPGRLAVFSRKTGQTRTLDIAAAKPLGVVDGSLIYLGSRGALMSVAFDESSATARGASVSVSEPANGWTVALSRSGTLVYHPVPTSGQLMLADRQGALRPLGPELGVFSDPRLSPDGRRIAVGLRSRSGPAETWIYDIHSSTLQLLTTDGRQNAYPEWTPDGRRVLFHTIIPDSARGYLNSLRWMPFDGSGGAETLLQLRRAAVLDGTLSPDGRFLVYRVDDDTRPIGSLWMRRLVDDTTPRRITSGPQDEWGARFSPDGRWLTFCSNVSGASQVYVTPFPSLDRRHQISANGGGAPVWSRDGKQIFYTSNGRLIAANIVTTGAFSVISRDTLFAADFLESRPHTNYDVSPDGARFVLVKPSEADREIVVVHNWRREIQERVAAARP